MEKITKINVNGVDYELAGSTSEEIIPQEITYSALVELKNSSSLIPENKYRIIDFVTSTNTEDHPGGVHPSAEHPFDLIVTAKDESNLYQNASAALHEGDSYFSKCDLSKWKITYKLINTYGYFLKGEIEYMEDEFGNKAPYDFKNYLIPAFMSFKGKSFYTFSKVELSGSEILSVSDLSLEGYVRNNTLKTPCIIVDILGMLKVKASILRNHLEADTEVFLKSNILANQFKDNEVKDTLKVLYSPDSEGYISGFIENKILKKTILSSSAINSSISNSEFRVDGSFNAEVTKRISNSIFIGYNPPSAELSTTQLEESNNIVGISQDGTKHKLIV